MNQNQNQSEMELSTPSSRTSLVSRTRTSLDSVGSPLPSLGGTYPSPAAMNSLEGGGASMDSTGSHAPLNVEGGITNMEIVQTLTAVAPLASAGPPSLPLVIFNSSPTDVSGATNPISSSSRTPPNRQHSAALASATSVGEKRSLCNEPRKEADRKDSPVNKQPRHKGKGSE
jgi:hypothetical protein